MLNPSKLSEPDFRAVVDVACEPYRGISKFAWHWAKGKLQGDPAFAEILRLGYIPDASRVLDLGCGQGLLSAYLLGAEVVQASAWIKGWAKAPRAMHVHGIELMQDDVDRARLALAEGAPRFTFECSDICNAYFPASDVVVILDVLHYVDYERQDDILRRVYQVLEPGGKLLLRVGDAAAGLPFKISNWVDFAVTFCRGHRLSRLYCRSVFEWRKNLELIGFKVAAQPMNQGTPFANVMFVCEKI
jgi:SAM-dependent methyltransferase